MSLIHVEGTTEIPHLLLNRPGRANALSAPLLAELSTMLEKVIQGGARAIVLAGSGPGFSAGADLGELLGTIDDLAVDERIARVTDALVAAPVPVIAALHGFCFGAGVDLAWSTDLVIATPETRMGVPATRLGLLYNPPSLARLYARLGSAMVRRLLLFGAEVSGQEAWQAGAVAQLVDTEHLRDRATEIAQNAARGLPDAVSTTKRFFNALDNGTICLEGMGLGGMDLEEWQKHRQKLMNSTDRQNVVRIHNKAILEK